MIIGLDASRANVEHRTGTERYAWEVLSQLLPLLAPHRVRLYVREPLRSDWPSIPPYVEVRVLKWSPGLLWSHLRLSWEMLWHPPNVLFVPADTVPIIHPRTTLTTIHDLAFERYPELYLGVTVQRRLGWLRPFVHGLVRCLTFGRYSASELDYHRWSARHASHACHNILTVSNFSKKEIIELLNVEDSRIIVTYLGVKQPEYYQSLTDARVNRQLQALHIKHPYFLFTGRLEKKKNIAVLIQAYQKYRLKVDRPVDLVLVGNPGFGWEDINHDLQVPGNNSGIHVLGWQSDDTLDLLQKGATALVMLSQYEGFGLPVIQSLSAGVPVLSSLHGSLPEVLDGVAIFVDPENQESVVSGMVKIIQDESLRSSLIAAGRKRALNFTWDRTVRDTLKVLMQ